MRAKSLFHLTLIAVSTALLLAVAFPIWKPLVLGAVLAASLSPWHERVSARLRGRRQLAGGLFVLALIVLVLLPFAWVVSVAVHESIGVVDSVREALQTHGPEAILRHLPSWAANPLRDALSSVSVSVHDFAAEVAKRAPATAVALGTALGATARAIVEAVFLLIAFYFFLLGGGRLVRWLAHVSPSPDETLSIAARLAVASRSVLSSLFFTALAQSVVATIGYLIARVPHPVFFGLLTFLAAFIPSIGTAIVALPVAVLMLALGHPWAALFLAIWALLVVGLIDNVVKPLLIKGDVHLDAAVLFFALIGGLALWGAVGLFLGPLAVSLFVAVVTRGQSRPHVVEAPDEESESAPH